MPHCTNLVEYHKRYKKLDGTWGYKWKTFCEYHRNEGKAETDMFKMSKGCENTDGHYGFICTSTIIAPEQIDVHHKDGNKNNNDPSNLELLCRNCHGHVTILNGHNKNRYFNAIELPRNLFDFDY